MTFSIFEGQEPSQIIFQVKAGLCYLEFSCSQWTFDLISAEQQGVTRRQAVFIICDFDEAELQSPVGVAYDRSWHPHTGSLNYARGQCFRSSQRRSALWTPRLPLVEKLLISGGVDFLIIRTSAH